MRLMRRHAFASRATIALFAALLMTTLSLRAQPAEGPALPLDEVQGKTGELHVALKERSPLSAPKEIARRLRCKLEDLGQDYDLSKRDFDVYVPPEPAADAKYGLMVGVVFLANHGYAPAAWRPVFDKYHLIWIASNNDADDRPAIERFGQPLDAAYNAPKNWPIDDHRVYACLNTGTGTVCGLGLQYPDVFTGTVDALKIAWFAKLTDEHTRSIWGTDSTPRPLEQYLGMAKSRPFALVSRDEGQENNMIDDLIFRRGYQQSGFKRVKFIKVTEDEMGHWTDYKGNWLEQAIQFLDAAQQEPSKPPASTAPSESASAASPTSRPATRPVASTGADASAKAAGELSLAKSYVAAKKYDLARPRLKKIIEAYPNTPAAKEAARMLAEIQGN